MDDGDPSVIVVWTERKPRIARVVFSIEFEVAWKTVAPSPQCRRQHTLCNAVMRANVIGVGMDAMRLVHEIDCDVIATVAEKLCGNTPGSRIKGGEGVCGRRQLRRCIKSQR